MKFVINLIKSWPIFFGLLFCSLIIISIYAIASTSANIYTITAHFYIIFIAGTSITFVGLFLDYLNLKLKIIYSLCWAAFYLFIFLIYVLTYIGDKLVGTPLSFSITFTYLNQLPDLLTAINASILQTYIGIIIILTAYLLIFILCADRIWKKLKNLRQLLIKLKKSNTPGASLLKVLVLAAVAILLSVACDFFKFTNVNARLYEAKEPIYLIFSPKKIGNISLAKNSESNLIQKKYPKILNFKRKNVVIIIVDDLRADYLSAYDYPENTSPFLNELVGSGKARKIEYAFANGSASFSGILSILTSKLWTNIATKNFAIHDVLKKQGYKINFILSGDHTSFYMLRDIFGKNIDNYIDGFTQNDRYLNDDDIVIDGLRKAQINSDNSNFFYLHLMSTHNLGVRKKENLVFKPASVINKTPQKYQNNYKNGILQTDRYIEKIFKILKTREILDNSIVIITSDHGESLGENGIYGHGNNVSNHETSIPLIIYDSDNKTNFYKEFAMQEDISPTITDRLGLPQPINWEGQSLLDHNRLRKYSFLCYKDSFAIILHDNTSIIKYTFNNSSKQEAVYDLKADPKEKQNIINEITNNDLSIFKKKMQAFTNSTK